MIYTECKPDSALVKTLGIRKKEIIHLGGKPEVCKQLEKRENSTIPKTASSSYISVPPPICNDKTHAPYLRS